MAVVSESLNQRHKNGCIIASETYFRNDIELPFVCALRNHSFILLVLRSCIYSIIHSMLNSPSHSFIHSFILAFMHSLVLR